MTMPLIALSLIQAGAEAPTAADFNLAPAIVENQRIAMTPILDGVIGEEEWDSLAGEGDVSTYFQWEPGKIHVAAKLPVGKDLLLSLDLGANGWLIGKDNLEIRLHSEDGKVTAAARLLDASGVNGPVWIPIPGFALSTTGVVKTDGTVSTLEATITDPGVGLLKLSENKGISLRLDSVDPAGVEVAAYLPRILAPVSLVFFRSAGLATGLVFRPEGAARSVVPNQSLGLRLTFQGKDDLGLTRLDMRGEGDARAATNLMEVPFPKFDKKNRAFVDYETNISSEATLGYRLLRGTLQTKDGVPGVTQTSFRIGPLVDVDLVQEPWTDGATDRSQKVSFYLRSNSGRGLGGSVKVSVPEPLRILNGNDRKFEIVRSHGGNRQVFELYIPRGTKGTFPITFDLVVNKEQITQRQFITIP